MMNVEWDAFDLTKSAKQLNWCTYSSLGSVINHNTMESFKSFDKVSGYLDQCTLLKVKQARKGFRPPSASQIFLGSL